MPSLSKPFNLYSILGLPKTISNSLKPKEPTDYLYSPKTTDLLKNSTNPEPLSP